MSLYPINATLQWEHNFEVACLGEFLWKLNWRRWLEIIYGTISDANRAINASGLNYVAPERAYWEYSAELEIFQIASTWFYMERELFK
jgi:hypothetical protein